MIPTAGRGGCKSGENHFSTLALMMKSWRSRVSQPCPFPGVWTSNPRILQPARLMMRVLGAEVHVPGNRQESSSPPPQLSRYYSSIRKALQNHRSLRTVKIGGKEVVAMVEKSSLRSPPVKVLAAQLKRCRQLPGGSWLLDREEYGRPALAVSLVWMQGKVLTVEQDGSAVRLLDESGSFVVSGVAGVPKGKPCLSPGNYVMVMGLVQGCIPEPVLQAVKMSDLSGNPLHRSMWELEVEDLQRSFVS